MINKPQQDQPRAQAEQIYRWVLHLYPPEHRRAFGEPMLRTFGDSYLDAVQQGGESEARFWLGVISDECQSLLREHLATLEVRVRSMNQLLPAVGKGLSIIIALLVWVAVLDLLFPITDGVPFVWLPATMIYAAVFVVISRLVYSWPRPVGTSSQTGAWWRLGLVLGGIVGLDLVVLDVLNALDKIGAGQASGVVADLWSLQALSLPLLAGASGIVAAYASGRVRTGLAAGALSGVIMLVTQAASIGLLLVVWNTLQPAAPPVHVPGGLSLTAVSSTPEYIGFANFLNLPNYLSLMADIASPPVALLIQAVLTVIVWPVPLLVGSVLGARAAHAADETHRPEAVANRRSGRATPRLMRSLRVVVLSLLLAVLGPMMWLSVILTQVFGRQLIFYGTAFDLLEYVDHTYLILTSLAWLLAVLVTLVAVYVAVQSKAARPAASAAPTR